MNQYFPKPYELFGGDINVKVDLKTDLKKATWIDTFNLALKSNLAKLKDEVDKIDFDKLKTALVDFRTLSDVVNNELVKETVYTKEAAELNNIDTNGLELQK